jgi:hypothetical protein
VFVYVVCMYVLRPNSPTHTIYYVRTYTYTCIYVQDLIQHIYRVVWEIDAARARGGKVLVHCHQGVSRSCSYCIVYTMLRDRLTYEEAYKDVKSKRGICNPNLGFSTQIMEWAKGLSSAPQTAPKSPDWARAYRVGVYFSEEVPEGGAKACAKPQEGGMEEYSWRIAARHLGVWHGGGGVTDGAERGDVTMVTLSNEDVYVLQRVDCCYIWEVFISLLYLVFFCLLKFGFVVIC